MAQTLKLKRGNNANLGGVTLQAGEPAFVIDTKKLYVGDGTDKVLINPDLTAMDIPTLSLSKISDAGTSASKNTGTAIGDIPVIGANGKIDDSLIGSIAITDTFVVADEVAMLALTAQVGDVAVRTDESKSYILKTSGASVLVNWQELLTPVASITDIDGGTF